MIVSYMLLVMICWKVLVKKDLQLRTINNIDCNYRAPACCAYTNTF